MIISSKKKYFIYIIGIIMVIAIAVAAADNGVRNGEIIFLGENKAERINNIITFEEDGVEVIIEGEAVTKYEKRSEFIVNINTASEEDMIRLLPGIGVKRAAAIVKYRELSGGFCSVEELSEVDGIGEKLLEDLRPYCTIEGPSVQYAGPAGDLSD